MDRDRVRLVSEKMQKIYSVVEKVGKNEGPVLITGESGTGKEIIAQLIHEASPRGSNCFFPINCASLQEDLVSSELFGHEKGAFTGAFTSKQGFFEIADTGTLFLDEIGDVPISTQLKLLRVLEQKTIYRVGGTKAIPVNTRIVFGTNRDLKWAVESGLFRSDLYYRINRMEIKVPPLRERPEDISSLLDHFLEWHSKKINVPKKDIGADVFLALYQYDWPGNIRELSNRISRAVELSENATITIEDLGFEQEKIKQMSCCDGCPLSQGNFSSDTMVYHCIRKALENTGQNKTRAAAILGMSLKTLHNWLNRLKK